MTDKYSKPDNDAFMDSPEDWNMQVATDTALAEGISTLTPDHVKLLETMRHHYLERGDLPPMRHLCRDAGLEENCVSELLSDPRRAWRIAGLPDPGEEAKAYLESAEQVPQEGTREKRR